jgi:hypothetical protein
LKEEAPPFVLLALALKQSVHGYLRGDPQCTIFGEGLGDVGLCTQRSPNESGEASVQPVDFGVRLVTQIWRGEGHFCEQGANVTNASLEEECILALVVFGLEGAANNALKIVALGCTVWGLGTGNRVGNIECVHDVRI